MSEAPSCWRIGAAEFDPGAGVVVRDGARLRLSPRETKVLEYLVRNADVTVSRAELYREIWGDEDLVLSRSLDVAIRQVRRKIEDDPARPRHLLTVYDAAPPARSHLSQRSLREQSMQLDGSVLRPTSGMISTSSTPNLEEPCANFPLRSPRPACDAEMKSVFFRGTTPRSTPVPRVSPSEHSSAADRPSWPNRPHPGGQRARLIFCRRDRPAPGAKDEPKPGTLTAKPLRPGAVGTEANPAPMEPARGGPGRGGGASSKTEPVPQEPAKGSVPRHRAATRRHGEGFAYWGGSRRIDVVVSRHHNLLLLTSLPGLRSCPVRRWSGSA
jgi:hypothetical protein